MIPVTTSLAEYLVLGYLHKYCRGAGGARTHERIARDLRGLGLDMTVRDIRDALAALVEGGWPAGTTCAKPPGAFLCLSRADFRLAYRNLYVRFRAQARRCRRFKGMAREVLSGQRRFDFAEAREAFADLECAPLLGPASLSPDRGRRQAAGVVA